MSTQANVVQFGEWLPDLPEYQNPGALIAQNVIPQLQSYRALNSLSSFSNALANVALGVFWAQDDAGVVSNFAGDVDALYELAGGNNWVDVSGPSAPYAVDNWEFTKFGDRVIAAGFQTDLQQWDLASSIAFGDLAGSPPRGRRIATVRDFVMVGDTDVNGGGGGSNVGPNFVQWSGFNNSELWTPSLGTQSDFQELFGRGGRVQKIVPGEYAVIFMEQSIFRADYAGPPIVFQFDEVERKKGTPAPNSVVWSGGLIWYYGWDGFYVFDGQRSQEISANRVSNWFALNAATDALDSMRGAVDRRNRLVLWAFRTSASAPINDRLIIYNWAADKWSMAEIDTQLIDEFLSPGFTLDELDGPLPLGIDLESIPVDSDQFAGGNLNLQAFDDQNQAATFDGVPLPATMDTKEISGPDNSRMFTNSVRPLVEASGTPTITVEIGSRNRLQDNVVFTPPKALNAINGEANFRVNSRYQRYRVNVADGFVHGNGVKAQSRLNGGRR
jgi:hypothetical protein